MYDLNQLEQALIHEVRTYYHVYKHKLIHDVFVHLIVDNQGRCFISLLAIELASNTKLHEYLSVVKLTGHELMALSSSNVRKLIESLVPKKDCLARYSNLEREKNKELKLKQLGLINNNGIYNIAAISNVWHYGGLL